MKKKNSVLKGMLMMAGGFMTAYMMYNSNMIGNMKKSLKKVADKVSNKMDDIANI